MTDIHPYYRAHRSEMEAALRQRLDLADELLRSRLGLADTVSIKQEIIAEFDTVLHQMPYVGGAASRMTVFFMRQLGFVAIGRVLRRRGVPIDVIGEIGLYSFKAQIQLVPETDRLEAGRQFMSHEKRDDLRRQAAESGKQVYPDDFVYDVVDPGPDDNFEFGVNYRACGFCKFAEKHGDKDLPPFICAVDFESYAARGIKLERTQTLAAGASHCNFRFRHQSPDANVATEKPVTETGRHREKSGRTSDDA